MASWRASTSSTSWRWVFFSPTEVVSSAISPNAVARPVAITAPSAWPPTTAVPMNSFASGSACDFDTGRLSPVSALSSTRSSTEWVSARSAGTLSPADSSTTSPGTISRVSIIRSWPSRSTRAWCASIERSASSAFSARHSWTKPSTPLRITTRPMAMASITSPSAAAMPAATIRMTTSSPVNCRSRMTGQDVALASPSVLGPTSASRFDASALVSPLVTSDDITPSPGKLDASLTQGRTGKSECDTPRQRWPRPGSETRVIGHFVDPRQRNVNAIRA